MSATFESSSLFGTPVVAGRAYGPILIARPGVSEEAVAAFRAGSIPAPEESMTIFDTAVEQVAEGYLIRADKGSGAAQEVLTASAGLARDPGLRGAVQDLVAAGGDLIGAVESSVQQFVEIFSAMGGLMAERATDLKDIQRRVVARIVGEPEPGVPTPTEASVLVAEDLAPADTAELDPTLVLALVTEKGGATSHTAIIARQLSLPCVVGVVGALDLPSGEPVLVDGESGAITRDPDPVEARQLVAQNQVARAALASWEGPAATADGVPVKLLANVGDGTSAVDASTYPLSGVGLFRTELCFLHRTEEPSVEAQADIYEPVLAAFRDPDQVVVVRTLDAGSDKPIAFATQPGEENPALGVRGLRLSFDHPELLDRQLDGVALAASRTGATTWVMAPMVATAAEATQFAEKVRSRGLVPGVMVEIPSAALLADRILEAVDFISIGTNDLTQYAMAADRMATDLAHLTDPWQPAVLHLIALTARAGKTAGKPVGVCGEAAADPALACVLVGLGVTSLSMAASAVRGVGARLSTVTQDQCRAAAEAALAAADPAAARRAVKDMLATGPADVEVRARR
jgi:phosphoenolpyruvate-protein phosphotransferase (PTS system enzyme I)